MYSWLVTQLEFTACWALGHWNTRPSAPFLQHMENYLIDKKKETLCSALSFGSILGCL